MPTISATELARRLRDILDRVEFRGESVTIMRNKREIATIQPGTGQMDARQAFDDLFSIVDEPASEDWLEQGRLPETLDDGTRDPWAT